MFVVECGGDVCVDGFDVDFEIINYNGLVDVLDYCGLVVINVINGMIWVEVVEFNDCVLFFMILNGSVYVCFGGELDCEVLLSMCDDDLIMDFRIE